MTDLEYLDDNDLVWRCQVNFMTWSDQSCNLLDNIVALQNIVRSCRVTNRILFAVSMSITHKGG